MAIRNQWDFDALGGTGNAQADYGATADDFRTSLHTVDYVPNVDTDEDWADTSDEIAGTGYTAQGHDHDTLTLSYDAGTNETRFDAEDAQWTAATFTARIAVFYNWQTESAATAGLHSYVNFGGDETVSSGTFTIQWAATGVAKITS